MVLEIVLLQNLDGVRHVNGYTDVFFELLRPCCRENDARLLVVCFAFAAAAVAAACVCRVQETCFFAIVSAGGIPRGSWLKPWDMAVRSAAFEAGEVSKLSGLCLPCFLARDYTRHVLLFRRRVPYRHLT